MFYTHCLTLHISVLTYIKVVFTEIRKTSSSQQVTPGKNSKPILSLKESDKQCANFTGYSSTLYLKKILKTKLLIKSKVQSNPDFPTSNGNENRLEKSMKNPSVPLRNANPGETSILVQIFGRVETSTKWVF